MSIFTKPISQIETSDLQEIVDDKAVENVRLEYKSQVPDKDETLKKLSSFANTYGGIMVVGAKASSADGRIEDMPGVDEQPGYKQKVVDWSFNGASPPLTVFVSDPIPVPAGTGKVCYVVRIDESDVAPHFLNGRKGVWVRTDEFSSRFEARLADENELRHLLDRRKLIRERRDQLLERARERAKTYFINHSALPQLSRLEVCVVPRFPARPLCDESVLYPLINRKAFQWRGTSFPIPGSTTISQHESVIAMSAAGEFSIFEANIWGMMFYSAQICDADNPAKKLGIHLYGFIGTMMLFVRNADSMLQKLGYSGPLEITTRLTSIQEVQWLYGNIGILSKRGSELDSGVEFSISTTSELLHDQTDHIIKDLLKYVFFAVNWPGIMDTKQELENLLRYGYRYNQWVEPESWQWDS
jgi:hypothetical protein